MTIVIVIAVLFLTLESLYKIYCSRNILLEYNELFSFILLYIFELLLLFCIVLSLFVTSLIDLTLLSASIIPSFICIYKLKSNLPNIDEINKIDNILEKQYFILLGYLIYYLIRIMWGIITIIR